MIDLHYNLTPSVEIPPDNNRTTIPNGVGVDTKNPACHGVLFVFNLNGVTNGTFTFRIEESSDGTTWTTVAAANLIGTAPTWDSTSGSNQTEIGRAHV